MGAGLAGGSSDGAAALLGLNKLWGDQLGHAQLVQLALHLGSDVPLFLRGPASRMRGRGELLTEVDLHPFWAILLCPPVACATAEVYAAFDRTAPRELQPIQLEKISGAPVDQWPSLLKNDLRAPACAICPQVADWAGAFSKAVAKPVLMTGSGSAFFTTFNDFSSIKSAFAKLGETLTNFARIISLNSW